MQKIWLHLGGREKKDGWTLLNVQDTPDVDIIGDIRDLNTFEDSSCEKIYASHVLEHVNQREIVSVLKDCFRLLADDGTFMISVPDLDILCRLYLDRRLSDSQRFHVMRMIFGGQTDDHDFHYIGYNFDFLASLLKSAGFLFVSQVDAFNIFNDTSNFRPYGVKISLNVVAKKQISNFVVSK